MKRTLATLLAALSLHAAAAPSPVPADDPRLQPASVTRVAPTDEGGIPEVYIDGYIHKQTVEDFSRLGLLNTARLGMVYFNSKGGDLVAAIDLGRLIRERGFSTRVGRRGTAANPQPGVCESGCPFAFAGGRFRFLDSESKMGVHQFYRAKGKQDDDLELGQKASTMIATHLSAMGVSLDLMRQMVTADSTSMHYLSPLEAYDLGLINGGALPANWGIQEVGGAIVLIGQQEKVQGTGKVAMACSKDNSVEFAALFKSWYDPSLLRALDEVALTFDGKASTPARLKISPELRNGFLTLTLHPTNDQLSAMTTAKALGVQFRKSGADIKSAFEVDATGATALIQSFIGLCHGSRPGLAGL